MLRLGVDDINRYRGYALQLRGSAARVIEQAQHIVHGLITASETFASAFAFGVVQGKWGGIELMGIPLELGVGTLLHVAAFALGGGSRAALAPHIHAFANGALAAYAVTVGKGAGLAWKEKQLADKAKQQGALPPSATASGSLTDDELARITRAA